MSTSRRNPANDVGSRVTPSTLTEDAYRLIKWRITTVQMAPGADFTESELAENLKLSRTPVREALLLLRTEGLVTVEGRSGYRVSPVTLRDVHDLALVRGLLEGEAAFLAAPRFNEVGQLSALRDKEPGQLGEDDLGAASRWIEADRRFHLALAVASGNQQLVQSLQPVLEKSARLLHLLLALESPAASVIHHHSDLLAALQNRDRDRARQVTVGQISAIEEAVSRALASSPSLLSANVVVDKPTNQFYLDVTPAELAGQSTPNQSRPPVHVTDGTHQKSRLGAKL